MRSFYKALLFLSISSIMIVAQAATALAADTNVYRLYNSKNGDHFYTTSFQESLNASCNGFGSYHIENPAFQVYTSQSGTNVPVYRLYKASSNHHFYTVNAQEKNSAVQLGYKYEGIGFYADSSQLSGDIPVYRLYSPHFGDHLYTTSADEKNHVLQSNSGVDYVDEGIAFWVNATAPLTIYRLWNGGMLHTGQWDRFYTGSREIFGLPCSQTNGYAREGLAFSVYNSPAGGLLPVRRFYKSSTGHHFYTTDNQEGLSALANGYSDEAVAFYTSPSADDIIYRFHNLTRGYLYVPAGAERDYLLSQGSQWQQETTAYNADSVCATNCTND